MHFTEISIKKYIELQREKNPSIDEAEISKRLKKALDDYYNEKLCSCGNDIWVVGSAMAGNGCYRCITGEKECNGDYEIESATFKRFSGDGRRHVDFMPKEEIDGVFDDDGYEVPITEIPLLCTTCKKHEEQHEFEYILCKLSQSDVEEGVEFVCRDYRAINS